MTRKNLETNIEIQAGSEAVWQVLADLRRMPEWSPQCRWMLPLGRLRRGTYTVNMNRRGRTVWPTMSVVSRFEPYRLLALRTLTNNSTWVFEITPTASGSRVTERREVPPDGTTTFSEVIVQNVLGGEEIFDDEMLEGMCMTLARIKAAVGNGRR